MTDSETEVYQNKSVCPECGSGQWATWGEDEKNCLSCGHREGSS